jgi:hypothetical protein
MGELRKQKKAAGFKTQTNILNVDHLSDFRQAESSNKVFTLVCFLKAERTKSTVWFQNKVEKAAERTCSNTIRKRYSQCR